jgi:hypothetical protein
MSIIVSRGDAIRPNVDQASARIRRLEASFVRKSSIGEFSNLAFRWYVSRKHLPPS